MGLPENEQFSTQVNLTGFQIKQIDYNPCNPGNLWLNCNGMNSRQNILERLRTIKPVLQQEFPLRRMALFGSWARNEQTDTSDVDILVEVDPSIGLRFVTLAERLESLLEQHVDLVSSRAVKPNLLKQIQAELIDV